MSVVKSVANLYRRYFWLPKRYARYLGVKIGDNCSIMTRKFGSEPYLIKIGNHVQITNDVCFFTHGGGWTLREEIPDFDCFGKISIGNNVYIGSCSLIMPGVTIGNNVIIGAGSVITKSIPDNSVVAGVPAKVIDDFNSYKSKILPFNVKSKHMDYLEKKKFLLSLSDEAFIKK